MKHSVTESVGGFQGRPWSGYVSTRTWAPKHSNPAREHPQRCRVGWWRRCISYTSALKWTEHQDQGLLCCFSSCDDPSHRGTSGPIRSDLENLRYWNKLDFFLVCESSKRLLHLWKTDLRYLSSRRGWEWLIQPTVMWLITSMMRGWGNVPQRIPTSVCDSNDPHLDSQFDSCDP